MSEAAGGCNKEGISCEICLCGHGTFDCSLLTKRIRIQDSKVPPKALLTLPNALEAKEKLGGGGYRIIAKEPINEMIQFGPLEAPLAKSVNPAWSYILKVRTSQNGNFQFLDLSNPFLCNWMSLVEYSEDDTKRNCICYQVESRIFFTVIRQIEIGEELLVGYSPGYRNLMKELQNITEPYHHEITEVLQDIRTKIAKTSPTGLRTSPHNRKEDIDYNPDYIPKKRMGAPFIAKSESDSINYEKCNLKTSLRKRKSNFERRKLLRRLGASLAQDEWNCKFCKAVFSDVAEFASHLILHYKLVGAARTEKGRESLAITAHNAKKSVPIFPYVCDICERRKEFNRAEYAIRHLKKHAQWYDCNDCGQIIRGGSHTCTKNKKIEPSSDCICSLCNKEFTRVSELAIHVKNMHKGASNTKAKALNLQSITCESCFETFLDEDLLKSHSCATITEIQPKIRLDQDESKKDSQFHEDDASDICIVSCSVCSKAIHSSKLKIHNRLCEAVDNILSGAKEQLECPICDSFLSNEMEFRSHVSQHTHPVMCPSCQLRLNYPEELKHHKCTDFPCDGCLEVFESFSELRLHIKNVHLGPGYYCFDCALPFVTKEGYRRHSQCTVNRKIPHSSENFKKQDKGLRPSDQGMPLRTKRRKRNQDGEFVCEICGAHYTKFSSMRTHLATHGPKEHRCDTCGKTFHRKQLLTDHIYVHLPPQFACSTCGKLMKTQKALDVHSRIHKGLKQYRCDFKGCGKAFTQKVNLKTHLRRHLPREERSFTCSYCPKQFNSKESCIAHVNSHFGGKNPLLECSLCSKSFHHLTSLRRHKRDIHGCPRICCEFCSFITKQKSAFSRHLSKEHQNEIQTWTNPSYIDSRIEKEGTDSKVSAPYSEVVEPNEAVAETLVESGLVEQQVEIEQIVELGHESIEYELEETNLIQTTDDAQSGIVIFHVNQAGEFMLAVGGDEIQGTETFYPT